METYMQEANTPTSRVTIPKAALLVVLRLVVLLVLWQVILSNRRAKDCEEQGGQQHQEGEMGRLSRGHPEAWQMWPLTKPWFHFQVEQG